MGKEQGIWPKIKHRIRLFLLQNRSKLVTIVLWILVVMWIITGIVLFLGLIEEPGKSLFQRQKQVVAARPLQAGQPIVEKDLATAWSLARNDVFTTTTELIGAFPTEAIESGKPLTHAQIGRYQVVTKNELDAAQQITRDDVELAQTPYLDAAYSTLEEVTGMLTRQPITRGITLVDSQIGQSCVFAARRLDASIGIILENDVKLMVCPGNDLDGFQGISEVVGLRPRDVIEAGTPITSGGVLQLQVVANVDGLENELRLDQITTEWREYDSEALVFTRPGELRDLRLKTPLDKGAVILHSMVEREYVAPKAGVVLEPGTILTNTDRFTMTWAEYDLYEGAAFTSPDQLKNHLVLTRLDDDPVKPVSTNALQACYAIASERLPAYHRIGEADLDINLECQTAKDVLKGPLLDPWEDRVTKQALDKGISIESDYFLGAGEMSDKTVVSLDMPASHAFNGELGGEREISLWLVPRESGLAQRSEKFSDVLLLLMTHIETGPASESEPSVKPTVHQPSVSVVVAIPKDKEASFLELLATSQAFLALEP